MHDAPATCLLSPKFCSFSEAQAANSTADRGAAEAAQRRQSRRKRKRGQGTWRIMASALEAAGRAVYCAHSVN
jgi:4'-phosphopantetheinyl transferase EntD